MIFKHLHQLALENGDAIHLLHECINFLRINKIVLPAITTLERMVWEARAMAEATPGLTYKQLAKVSQWRMYEDAMNKAQAVLVNFHHKLQLSSYWGDGTTSSSDGMRMQLGVSSLHADANPH